jgi:hypothetical protein
MSSIGAISQPYNFVEANFGLNAAQLCPVPADVDGEDFLGEDVSIAVGAKNPYLDFDLLTRLTAPAHPFEQPPVTLAVRD